MRQYNITGMSCAACQARVEKAVNSLEGIESCSVSLLTNSMGVEGSADDKDIIEAIEKAGYGASIKESEGLNEGDISALVRRLVTSLIFLLILMYFSMGHMMLGFPIPAFLEGKHIYHAFIQMILSLIVMIINRKFFISGSKSLLAKAPNMDSLVALGSGVSFVYSLGVTVLMIIAKNNGNEAAVGSYMHDLYYESAAMILTLITVGKMLEARSKGKTTDAIKRLLDLSPKTAHLIRDGKEITVPVEEVKIDDLFAIRPGESIPVDGIVNEGVSAIDESALTGESIPVDKAVGDRVFAGTINSSGYLVCRADRVGRDTTLSQIIRLVSDAAATKAPIARIADRVSGVFVPIVLVIAAITFIVWMILKGEPGFAVARAISVLVISCPCALGLATPVAIMVGSGVGAKNGILFKTAVSIEETGKADIVVLDKTGTITNGKPVVTDCVAIKADSDNKLLKLAGILEKKSEHPLSKAVTQKCEELNIDISDENSDFEVFPGKGLKCSYNGMTLIGGNSDYILNNCEDKTSTDEVNETVTRLSDEGKTPLIFATYDKILGIIAVADTLRQDSVEAIKQLKKMGLYVVMLTGDNARTAKATGAEAGVDRVIAGVYPDGKSGVIEELKKFGKVIMVGDGINDAPALAGADTGMAIGAGTDVAIDSAEVVLMNSSVKDVAAAVRLSRATLKNIYENLFWAFIYNMIGIPLAAGVFYNAGLKLSPMIGAAAMSLSSFCVVSNALRLNMCRIHDATRDRTKKKTLESIPEFDISQFNKEIKKESKVMVKTMNIEGMMCAHCEASVKKALESIDGVSEAIVSHEKNNAVVTLSKEVSNDVLKDAVEAKDYKVLSVE